MASMSMMAQTKGGGISAQMLQQMEKSQKGGTAKKALFNAIANNNIDDLGEESSQRGPGGYSFQHRDSRRASTTS